MQKLSHHEPSAKGKQNSISHRKTLLIEDPCKNKDLGPPVTCSRGQQKQGLASSPPAATRKGNVPKDPGGSATQSDNLSEPFVN